MVALLDRLSLERQNLVSAESLEQGLEVHLADSVVGCVVPDIRSATALCDLGSGGGFPGLVLGVALQNCSVTLVESERRKAEWLLKASADSPNVRVVHDRSEHLAQRERERFDVVTARAVGPLPVALELAAPLVRPGGVFVAWRARNVPEETAAGAAVATRLGFASAGDVVDVQPVRGADRFLQVWRKIAPTDGRYPRRAGMAAKRPLD